MPQKTPWSAKIIDLRKRLGMNQVAFAEVLATKQSNVSKWESGAYKPSPEQFMNMAKLSTEHPDYLVFCEWGGVPASWFSDTSQNKKGLIPVAVADQAVKEAAEKRAAEVIASGEMTAFQPDLRFFPLLHDAAAAGSGRDIKETEIDRVISMPTDWLPKGGTLYGVPVDGDSMSPILRSGDVVIVDVNQRDPKKLIERMVAARDGDGVTIKWLRKDGNDYLLVPQHTSPAYPVRIMRPNSGMDIVGAVVKWIGAPPKPLKVR